MFNKSYQIRASRQGRAEREAVRKAGGGHQVAADAALRLPWAGIFEPWRPLVLTAMAAHEGPLPPKPPANERKKKKPRAARVLPGQMDLFPLSDLIPEAYETIDIF